MAKTIMIIRHGEKPEKHKKGILLNGKKNDESLIINGWIRAGALSYLFRSGYSNLPTPTELHACYKSKHAQRALETITPLATMLGLPVNTNINRDNVKDIANIAKKSKGVVLISWEHQCIHLIANEIVDKSLVPQVWPDDRFNVVYIFTLGDDGKYTFSQMPLVLLHGDLPTPIKV